MVTFIEPPVNGPAPGRWPYSQITDAHEKPSAGAGDAQRQAGQMIDRALFDLVAMGAQVGLTPVSPTLEFPWVRQTRLRGTEVKPLHGLPSLEFSTLDLPDHAAQDLDSLHEIVLGDHERR